MKKTLKRATIIILLLLFIAAGIFYKWNFLDYGHWECVTKNDSLSWIRFTWGSGQIGNKKVDSASIIVPVTVEGIRGNFTCQFDIGRDITAIDQDVFEKYAASDNGLQSKWHPKNFLNVSNYLSPLQIALDGVVFKSCKVLVSDNFKGNKLTDTSHINIGAIGVDICKNKVLIMDYPHRRLCVTDTVPAKYKTFFYDITLNASGEPILKMEYKGRQYRILYDCGSSIFPLLVNRKLISTFSNAPVNDTFSIPESMFGGELIKITGRLMKDSFTLAGHSYGNIEIYSSQNKGVENASKEFDAITGNILFIDKVVVVDFRHRKIGMLLPATLNSQKL